jgi:PKD repeat protein
MTGPLDNAFHSYSIAGSYTVCLKIYKYSASSNDSAASADVCKTLIIPGGDVPDSCKTSFSSSGSTATALTEVFLAQPWHNHNKKPEEICWNFGDNHDTCIRYDPAVSSNYEVHHTYAQSGQYPVCIKVRYQGGCLSEYCHAVAIGGDPCKINYTTELIAASPLSRHFITQPWNAQEKKPVRICWDFGDGSTECKQYSTSYTEPYTINHTFARAGQYSVCVRVLYDGGCEAKKCKTITIETPADSCFVNVFEAATDITNPERHFYAGTMQDRKPESICWIFGDGRDTCIHLPDMLTPQSLVITHHYPAPGVYHICVRVKYAGGCEAQKCREVIIRSASSVCGGYMTDSLISEKTFAFRGFSIQNANDHPVSWRWTFGDGTSSNDQSVSHTYAAAGNYEVCLYIKTDLGCETRICNHITVPGESKPRLVLTPNPVTTTLHASFLSVLQEQLSIHIYDVNGVLIKSFSRAVVTGTNTWEFDVTTLTAGIYSVVVTSPHQLANAIFFKQ